MPETVMTARFTTIAGLYHNKWYSQMIYQWTKNDAPSSMFRISLKMRCYFCSPIKALSDEPGLILLAPYFSGWAYYLFLNWPASWTVQTSSRISKMLKWTHPVRNRVSKLKLGPSDGTSWIRKQSCSFVEKTRGINGVRPFLINRDDLDQL